MDNPKVSFCLKSYNQKAYLKDALMGAFSQTYSPMEIIIADDGSTDGSDEMIQKLICQYRNSGGCHEVIYTHNENNLGIALNCQKAYSLATGEIIVNADGDDVSYPNRVSSIVEAWSAHGMRASVILHGADTIGVDGRKIGTYDVPRVEFPLGAMMAYSKRVVSDFLPIEMVSAYDDDVYAWRALMISDVALSIPKALIAYRIGAGSTTKGDFLSRRRRANAKCLASGDQIVADLVHINSKLPNGRYEELRHRLDLYLQTYMAERAMLSNSPWIKKILPWLAFCKARGCRIYGRTALRMLLEYLHN